MEELYIKKVDCPVCNNKFATMKVKSSRLRLQKKDSDFLAYYKGENPIKYGVFVCPECGYSAMEEFFEKISDEGKRDVKELISSKWTKRDFSGPRTIEEAIECHKLALYCGQVLSKKSFELGKLCLRTAWLHRIGEDPGETRFLELSLAKYIEAYENEPLSRYNVDELTMEYLIGELFRRVGNNKEALVWLGKVISNPFIKANPSIEKLTREQWKIARECQEAN